MTHPTPDPKAKSPEEMASDYLYKAYNGCPMSWDVKAAYLAGDAAGYARARAEMLEGEPDGWIAFWCDAVQSGSFNIDKEDIDDWLHEVGAVPDDDWQIVPVKIVRVDK